MAEDEMFNYVIVHFLKRGEFSLWNRMSSLQKAEIPLPELKFHEKVVLLFWKCRFVCVFVIGLVGCQNSLSRSSVQHQPAT